MGSVKDEISKNLLYYRKKKHYTQQALAQLLGVRNNTVSQWENGTNAIDLDTLYHICKILNISISNIFGRFSLEKDTYNPEAVSFLEIYQGLDFHGKQTVEAVLKCESSRIHSMDDNKEVTAAITSFTDHLLLNAAHERTDIAVDDEMRSHDEDIMDDENF